MSTDKADSVSAVVRIRLVVEVTVGNWGGGSSFVELREQATREAKQQMKNVINNAASSIQIISAQSMHVKLVGEVSE